MKKYTTIVILITLISACREEETNPQPSTDEVPHIVINEFLASNTACCQDPAGDGEYDDWIEIYNAGDTAVDIGGWYVSDKADQLQKFRISTSDPSETTIQPGDHLVLWADNQPEQGALHLDFALNADGEYIGLFTPEGNTVDETTFGAQSPDVSTARLPNGTGDWSTTNNPTPGAANK